MLLKSIELNWMLLSCADAGPPPCVNAGIGTSASGMAAMPAGACVLSTPSARLSNEGNAVAVLVAVGVVVDVGVGEFVAVEVSVLVDVGVGVRVSVGVGVNVRVAVRVGVRERSSARGPALY